jgi:anti-sigma factor RsiW
MNHDAAARLLDAYLDDELDPGTALSIEEHVRECGACTDWLQARRALLARLRTPALRHAVPAELEQRLAQALRAAEPQNPARVAGKTAPRMPAWLPALAASLLLIAGGFFLGRSALVGSSLDNEFVAAHVRSLLNSHTVDVASSDHHTVKPWFAGRLAFAPPVPQLVGAEDVLLGGRLDYIAHQRVAVLAYQHGKHAVSVFVFPRDSYATALRGRAAVDGYRLLASRAGEFVAVFVSDASAAELSEFARRWLESAPTA